MREAGKENREINIREDSIVMKSDIAQLMMRLDKNTNMCAETIDGMYDDIVLRIRQYFLEEQNEDIIVSYPSGWWQALKQDYLKGLAKFFPVKKSKEIINVKTRYPDVWFPKERSYFVFKKIAIEEVSNVE
ncbi:MAG: hypothetical protein GY718_03135 [Lentisphaerae bacterium]|nr:hypothetical protein [Lentisphaerota bacterium]